ncbi:MAG: HU family DNA-binding protein [Oscillospiraceae bacterium]|jgi:DNA-binding protein HU-beta|nr:HU family DNA-binding protein [Oscillospiraceae bacterium]
MNKPELVSAVAEKAKIEKSKAESFVNAFVETIIETLAKGDKIQLIGFGTFSVKHREARTGHNPSSGKKINIEASNTPAFKPGKTFKEAVN